MESKQAIYQKLELISSSGLEVKQTQSVHLFGLNRIWQSLIIKLAQKHDLSISQKREASGNKWWKVDDPITHQRADLASEIEVLLWLEKRFYR